MTKKNDRPKGKIKNLGKIQHYLRPYKIHIIGAFIALSTTATSVLAIGYALRYLVDEGFNKGDVDLLNKSFIIMIGVIFILAIATYARYFLVTYIGERIVADIRRDIYNHLVNLHIGFFEKTRIGELLSRLTTDTTLLQAFIGSSVSIALRNILTLIGGCIMLFITSPMLSFYVFMAVPFVVAPIIILGKKVRKLSNSSQEKVADISSHAEETISNIRTLSALNLQKYEEEKFSIFVEDSLKIAIKRIRMRSLLTAIVIIFVLSAIMLVLWLGGHDVISGKITAGELSSFVFYAMLVAGSTGAISEVMGVLQRAAGATERLMELKSVNNEIIDGVSDKIINIGKVEFKNVNFSYPARQNTPALDGVSFTINQGEKVAIVGASGAGKSTIINLILRFYDICDGKLLIDGVCINNYKLTNLRDKIALVPQDSTIFSGTARDNILLGKPNASNAEIINALQHAEILEFVENLPNGLDTYLGEKGVRLSGGQKQRIAIARALIRGAEILLLDEATSALDSSNEKKVQNAIDNISDNCTKIIIAHRLSTVQNADRIIVMDKGKICAKGTHTELLQKSEIYAKLAKGQL